MYYNRHRYYDPEICQYISPDPIGMQGGLLPQAYVHNPLEWVDPFGLIFLCRWMNGVEYNNLIKKKNWEYGNGTMEGKWFAESYDDAVTWGHQMGHAGDKFWIVQVYVPNEIADNFFRVERLDNIGPARYAELEDLNAVNTFNEPKAKPKACKSVS